MNNKEKLNNNIIEVELNDGKKVNANIVFTFEENGDQFILYEIDDVITKDTPRTGKYLIISKNN